MNNTRQKGLFDCNNTFCKELACGLRSVRKELMNIHPQSTHTQQLIEYVCIFNIYQKHILKFKLNINLKLFVSFILF